MSVVIETLVVCDDCGDNCACDDRCDNAKQIRASRKRAGWIQIGSLDYCDRCAPNHRKRTTNHQHEQAAP